MTHDPQELERRFLENASLQASIEYARQHPEQRVGRRLRPKTSDKETCHESYLRGES